MTRFATSILFLAALAICGSMAKAEKSKPAAAKTEHTQPGTKTQPTAPPPSGDTREGIELNPAERARMLEGMRLYLQALQGVVESLAKNQLDGVAQYAHEAGAKMLQDAPMSIPLKAPVAFTALSLNTHEKFDVLADRARAASRGEVLEALAEIMANCTGCHSTYRVLSAQ